MTADALHDAVRAAPDEDGPRLVLADALLEKGDARGELIAVQCELARGGFSRERGLRLRRREAALLAEHGKAWSKIALPSGDVEGELRRGFVEAITIDADRLLDELFEVLSRAPLLREVRVTGLEAHDLRTRMQRVEQIIDLPQIEGIDLAGGGGFLHQLATQKRLGKLTSLTLRDAAAGALGFLSRSRYADRIEHLSLRGRLSPSELPDDATSLRPRVLHLHDEAAPHDIGSELDRRLRAGIGAPLFDRVEDLAIGSPEHAFAGTGVLPRLRKLRCRTSFDVREVRLLADSPELSRLDELHLERRASFGPQGLPMDPSRLFRSTTLARLRVLALGARLDEEDAARFLDSPMAGTLEVLDLRASPDVAAIAATIRARWDGIVLA